MPTKSPALVVAGAAAVLLVAVIAVDLNVNRTLFLDMREDAGWRTLAQQPSDFDEFSHPREGTVVVDASDTLEFRLRVDNEYPWGYSEPFRVRSAGVIVAEGRLVAGASDEGVATFTLQAADIAESFERPEPREGDSFGSIEVQVGGDVMYASFTIREDSS